MPGEQAELQKRANRANQLVLFFLAGANFWEIHAKNRQKHAKNSAFLVLNFLWEKLVGANFYAFCNYALPCSSVPLQMVICKEGGPLDDQHFF